MGDDVQKATSLKKKKKKKLCGVFPGSCRCLSERRKEYVGGSMTRVQREDGWCERTDGRTWKQLCMHGKRGRRVEYVLVFLWVHDEEGYGWLYCVGAETMLEKGGINCG